MSTDPFRRLPERARVGVAAVLSLAPMGLVWSVGTGFQGPGSIIDGDCGYDEDTYVCNPTEYVPGSYQPGHSTLVSQSPVRVFLVVAAVALALVALRIVRDAHAEAALRIGVVALALGAVVSAVHGVGRVLACLLLALALAAPLVLAGRRTNRVTPAHGAQETALLS